MEKYLDTLQNSPLFRGLTADDISAALHSINARAISKAAGEYVLYAGDTTDSMGIVLSGSVQVVQDDAWGHRNIMTQVNAGDIFAEIFASVPGAVLNVSVLANENSEILLLNTSRLLNAAAANSAYGKIARNLVSVLARKTMALNDKVTHLSRRTTREKLLSFLSAEALRQGSRSFDIAYNRQQLADYLCVERAAMSAELSKLQKEGLLSYHKSHFELKELAEV